MIPRRSAERKFDALSAVGDFELTCRILCQNPDGKSAFPQKRGDGLLLGDPELKAGAARRGFRPAMLNGDQIGVGPDAPAPRFRPCGADQCRLIENLAGEGGELLQIDRGSRSGDNPELTAEGNRAEIDRGVRFLEGEDSLAAGDAVPGKLKLSKIVVCRVEKNLKRVLTNEKNIGFQHTYIDFNWYKYIHRDYN